MKRLLALIACTLFAGAAVTSCGGGSDDAGGSAAPVDKLTIVGSGS